MDHLRDDAPEEKPSAPAAAVPSDREQLGMTVSGHAEKDGGRASRHDLDRCGRDAFELGRGGILCLPGLLLQLACGVRRLEAGLCRQTQIADDDAEELAALSAEHSGLAEGLQPVGRPVDEAHHSFERHGSHSFRLLPVRQP